MTTPGQGNDRGPGDPPIWAGDCGGTVERRLNGPLGNVTGVRSTDACSPPLRPNPAKVRAFLNFIEPAGKCRCCLCRQLGISVGERFLAGDLDLPRRRMAFDSRRQALEMGMPPGTDTAASRRNAGMGQR